MTLHNTTCPACAERARVDAILAFTKKQDAIFMRRILTIKKSNMNDADRRAASDKLVDNYRSEFNVFFDNLWNEIRASYGLAPDPVGE